MAAAITLGACTDQDTTASVLVQGSDVGTVAAAVRTVGGEVTHELGIINAVGARLTRQQLRRLEATNNSLRIHADRGATVAGQSAGDRRAAERAARKAAKDAAKTAKGDKRSRNGKRSKSGSSVGGETPQDNNWHTPDAQARENALKYLLEDVEEEDRALDKLERVRNKEEKEWQKEWGKDAHLKGTKPTYLSRPRQRQRTARPADHRSRGHGRRDRLRAVG